MVKQLKAKRHSSGAKNSTWMYALFGHGVAGRVVKCPLRAYAQVNVWDYCQSCKYLEKDSETGQAIKRDTFGRPMLQCGYGKPKVVPYRKTPPRPTITVNLDGELQVLKKGSILELND